MNKKHFFILGRVGLVYYSWLLIVLFVSLILAYESTKAVNWPAIVIFLVFGILLLYTFMTSFWTKDSLKLPFTKKVKKNLAPKLVYNWQIFRIYEVKVTDLEKYYLFRFEKRN